VAKKVLEIFDVPENAEIPDGEVPTVLSRMQDALLLAAYQFTWTRHEGKGDHPLAFVQRAKQIVAWCQRPIPEQTPLKLLEGKARELARIIGRRLFHGDEFVLVLANQGEGGHMTWISSMPRATTHELLTEFLTKLNRDGLHEKRS
jgi:hypothetical protein